MTNVVKKYETSSSILRNSKPDQLIKDMIKKANLSSNISPYSNSSYSINNKNKRNEIEEEVYKFKKENEENAYKKVKLCQNNDKETDSSSSSVMELDNSNREPINSILRKLELTKDPSLVYKSNIAVAQYYQENQISQFKNKDQPNRIEGEDSLLQNNLNSNCNDYLNIKSLITLFDYQEKTIQFIENREKDINPSIGCKGGIIAHEQGMGKTQIMLQWIFKDNLEKYKITGNRFNGATLIILKKILLNHWITELNRNYPKDTFKYYILNGKKRKENVDKLCVEHFCDIVFTTYPTVTSIFKYFNRSSIPPYSSSINTNKNNNNNNNIEISKGEEEQLYEEEEEDDDEEQEEEEEEEDMDLDTKKYTYDILHNIKYKRIVLDESQEIVNMKTKVFKATKNLKGDNKWCISGTLIENYEKDIYAPLSFIGVKELASFTSYSSIMINKETIKNILNTVMFRLKKQDVQLPEHHLASFKPCETSNEFIEFNSIQEKMIYLLYASFAKLNRNCTKSIVKLRQICMNFKIVKDLIVPNGILIRNQNKLLNNSIRFKKREDQSLIIPSLFKDENDSSFSKDSIEYHASMMDEHSIYHYSSFTYSDLYKKKETESEETEDVNKKEYSFKVEWNPFIKNEHFNLNDKNDQQLYKQIYDIIKESEDDEHDINLNHLIIKEEEEDESKINEMKKHILSRILPIHSTKSLYIINFLKTIPLDCKLNIFCDSVKLLEDLAKSFNKVGIKYRLVIGKNKLNNNNEIYEYKMDPTIRVLLLSLKIGAVGINLTCSNYTIFPNPWWNPNANDQAEQRNQRIGQQKNVYIKYLIIKGTIEENVLNKALNKKKISRRLLDNKEEQECLDKDDLFNYKIIEKKVLI